MEISGKTWQELTMWNHHPRLIVYVIEGVGELRAAG
jgi:hypothetical protein